jgi:hypothetical protein
MDPFDAGSKTYDALLDPVRIRAYASPMRCRRRLVVLPALVVASILVDAAVARPLAHHSVPGQFDMSKSVTLTGTISKVDWINPHPYVHLDAKGGDAKVTAWALSTLPIPMLRKAGLTKAALFGKPGEVVTIVANPARNGKAVGWIVRITYADGHYYRLFE